MESKKFKTGFVHYLGKLESINELYGREELLVGFDRLKDSNLFVDYELLYFKTNDKKEKKGLFIFGNNFFTNCMKDNEFKQKLGWEHLNYQIYNSYFKLKNKEKINFGISINEIVNDICTDGGDVLYKNKILKRIMSLVHHNNWDLKKDENSIDMNYFISIPEQLSKPKQRFNTNVAMVIKNDDSVLFFLNQKGDLCLVFKKLDNFNQENVLTNLKLLKKEFKIGKIEIY